MDTQPIESPENLAAEVARQIHQHGWALLCTAVDDAFLHLCTLGLELTSQHQDLEVLAMPHEMGSAFLNELAGRIQQGARFRDGDFFSDLVEGYDLFLVQNPEQPGGPPVTNGRLRLIWPDAANRYPWHADCDEQCALQRAILPPNGMDLESLYALLGRDDQPSVQAKLAMMGKKLRPS